MDARNRRHQLAEQVERVASRYITRPGCIYVIGVRDTRPRTDPAWVPGWDILCADLDEATKCARAIAEELGLRTNVRNPYNSAIVYAQF